ncbi:MAG: type II toxin-antitoxin system ParD family antitoxin [Limisphaerales bacterium]
MTAAITAVPANKACLIIANLSLRSTREACAGLEGLSMQSAAINFANSSGLWYGWAMAVTLNISLSEEQASWVKSRKEQGDYASVSDVVRDLIRREREKDLSAIEAEFERLDKRGQEAGAEPVEEIMPIVQRVKRERREVSRRS